MNYESLKQQVVIVTGATSGMGKSAAELFAQSGAKVVVAARSKTNCEEVAHQIYKNKGDAIAIPTDVSDLAQVEALVSKTVAHYGQLNCAFNNAGITTDILQLDDVSEELFEHVMNVNFKSIWACMKYQLPEIRKLNKGAIVNNASVAGLRATPGYALYGASKAAVSILSASAAKENGQYGIRINSICPGFIETPMSADLDPEVKAYMDAANALGRSGKPQEVAALALWLCSDQASYVTGQNISVDAGFSA